MANGNTDSTMCDGAPVYQLEGTAAGESAVLFRSTMSDGTSLWFVGPSQALAECYEAVSLQIYLQSNGNQASASTPDAAVYSAGAGWIDVDADPNGSVRGSIHLIAGDGSGH